MAKARSYDRFDRLLRPRLRGYLTKEEMRRLHARSGGRHALLAGRHALLYAAIVWALIVWPNAWIAVPLVALQGIHILGFTILLHEVIHGLVFRRRRPVAERLLGGLYAFPAGLSAAQFERWHLDHHRELGSPDLDPKRARLSPRRNARWFKFLYMTPWLFVIYFRAAAAEARGYPEPLQRRIRRERLANVCVHAAITAALWLAFDPMTAVRAWLAPLFLAFPAAFTINRLGQHYDVDDRRPERMSTLVNGNGLVRWLFLSSNHHLEHHYYPGVPAYALAELNRRLQPFFAAAGMTSRSYTWLLWQWFAHNRRPHTDWEPMDRAATGRAAKAAAPHA